MNKVVVAMMAAVLLAGCATTAEHKVDPAAATTSFQPGVTTTTQVEAALGQPFLVTRTQDGGQQWQYVTKHQEVADDGTPTTGSHIAKRVEKSVSTLLVFDQSGHFVSASSNSKTKESSGISDLGHLNSGEVAPQAH